MLNPYLTTEENNISNVKYNDYQHNSSTDNSNEDIYLKTKNILDKTNSPQLSKIAHNVYSNYPSKSKSINNEYNAKFKSVLKQSLNEFPKYDVNNKQDNCSKYEYLGIIRNWKEKYYQLLDESENIKSVLNREKLKNHDSQNLKHSYQKSIEEVNELKRKMNNYNEEKEQIIYKYHQSESVRKEQSRLIQSLHKEVDRLSNNTVNTETINKLKECSIEKVKEFSEEQTSLKEKNIKKRKKITNGLKSKSVSKKI